LAAAPEVLRLPLIGNPPGNADCGKTQETIDLPLQLHALFMKSWGLFLVITADPTPCSWGK
jgi:hypothetical protein